MLLPLLLAEEVGSARRYSYAVPRASASAAATARARKATDDATGAQRTDALVRRIFLIISLLTVAGTIRRTQRNNAEFRLLSRDLEMCSFAFSNGRLVLACCLVLLPADAEF